MRRQEFALRLFVWTGSAALGGLLALAVTGCGSGKPTAADFHTGFQSAGGVWLHIDRDAGPLNSTRYLQAGESLVEHYWEWRGAGYGPLLPGREVDVYCHESAQLYGPRGYSGDPGSFLVENNLKPGSPRDEIHVIMGPLATLPKLMAELHMASILPDFRDYWHQDPARKPDWDRIEGYWLPPTQLTPAIRVVGLQELVVARLRSRR